MSLSTLMNSTCTLKAETQTKDANGYESAPILAVVASNVPCRFAEIKPEVDSIFYGKRDSDMFARVYFSSDPQIQSTINWINFNDTDYEVISVINAGGILGRLWMVDVQRKAF